MIDSFNNDICFIANLIPVPTTYPSTYLPYLLSCNHYLGHILKKGGNPSSSKAKDDDSDSDSDSSSSSLQLSILRSEGVAADDDDGAPAFHVFGSIQAIEQYDLITKKTIARFKNQTTAAASVGGQKGCINMCVLGKQDKYKKFGWRFAERRRRTDDTNISGLWASASSSSRSSSKG